jgi:hypothetical protein
MSKWFVMVFAVLSGFLFCWDCVLLSIVSQQERTIEELQNTIQLLNRDKEQTPYGELLMRRLA